MEWWLWLLTAAAMAVCLYFFVGNTSSSGGGGGRVPRGSRGWPLVGETLHFIAAGRSSRPVSFMEKRKALYGEVFKTHLLGKPMIVSTNVEVNRVVLLNHDNCFVPSYPKSVKELFGDSSILNIDGPIHRKMHSSIGRFLRSHELKVVTSNETERSVKAALASWLDRPPPIYFQDETKHITFEILVKVLMNIGPGEDLELIRKEYKEFVKGLGRVPIKLPGTQLYKSLKAKERLLKVTRRIVEERMAWIQQNADKSSSGVAKDLVEVLLREAGVGGDRFGGDRRQLVPLDSICSTVVTMMIPGEDPVPMAVTLAVNFLSRNPVALDRLLEENLELKRKKSKSPTGCYHWTDYTSLTFTQHVISETLRMANIANAVWRETTEDVEVKGYLIPKGWVVLASFTSIHMDEQNYENPYDFDPWRWERKGSPNNGTSTFTPFGGGQKLCPGADLSRLEVSIFLHHFVTTYSWVAEEDEIVSFPTAKMKRRLPISVAPRPQF